MVRHVRLRRDVRECRETFVSFLAPTPGVSRHAVVTVTARNARRFVRHGVSITRVGLRSDDRVSLYINHFGRWPSCRPSTTYYPSFSSRARRVVRFCPTHVSASPPPPSSGLRVRPVCQPVLLTDVRIDNLCPLIMTVRSRARRYLTVRVIAILSSILHPPTNRDQSSKISFELQKCQAKSRTKSWRLEVFPNAFVRQE